MSRGYAELYANARCIPPRLISCDSIHSRERCLSMNRAKSDGSHNRLLASLSTSTRQRLLSECERVPLERSIDIGRRGRGAEHAYFPLAGFVSQVLRLDDGQQLEL